MLPNEQSGSMSAEGMPSHERQNEMQSGAPQEKPVGRVLRPAERRVTSKTAAVDEVTVIEQEFP